jgi:xanthine dehydrogenase accessory factor
LSYLIPNNDHSDIFTILGSLEQGEDLLIITILSRQGSTPRPQGTRMLITSAGQQLGTIGGGMLEAEIVRAGRKVLQEARKPQVLHFSSEARGNSVPYMICGGSLQVLLEYLPADSYHLKLWQDALDCYEKPQNLYMFIPLPTDSDNQPAPRFFIQEDGIVCGDCPQINPDKLREMLPRLKQAQVINIDKQAFLLEPHTVPAAFYIFGAGHIASELAPLAVHLGFAVSVLDDRAVYLDGAAFEHTRTILVPGFEDCLQDIKVDENTYLLIMTRDHQYDQAVLAQLLRTPACYTGMVGSRRKRDTIFKSLMEQGFLAEELQKVTCPAGLEIGADSPAEIAISIMAQIIHLRSGRK